ncbi:MAG: metallophosphoesterase [Salinivirgaceae bacterium]|jgi:predicted phosphodiesterase|nr:metallophosphoesterase [Salinivirgaceae bacterium]
MRYAIISDIHEDIVNLRFALSRIEKQKCDEIICLGDISGFSAPHYNYYTTRNASECLALIRNKCKILIAGNHDLHAARLTPKINPEYEYPKNWYSLDFYEKLQASNGYVWLYDNDELNPLYSHSDIAFLSTLPEIETIKTNEQNILLSHYAYPNITGSSKVFYNYWEDFEAHFNFMKEKNTGLSFIGHRHFSGLLIASKNKLIEKRFGVKYKCLNGDCILVPAITGKRNGNGFCIFDTQDNTVQAFHL